MILLTKLSSKISNSFPRLGAKRFWLLNLTDVFLPLENTLALHLGHQLCSMSRMSGVFTLFSWAELLFSTNALPWKSRGFLPNKKGHWTTDMTLMLQMMVSDAQKELLRMCWRSIQKNLESVGVVTFLKVLQLTSIIDNFGYFNAGNVVMPSSSPLNNE